MESEEMVLVPDRGLVPRSRISDGDIKSMTVKCTVCCKQVFHRVISHPYLNVLICRDCAKFYGDGDFSQDELGDKYCRWCAQGGKLNVCDFCTNAFCNECIRRNFGRGEVGRIKGIKWHCYICSPEQLAGLVAYCHMILNFNRKRKRTKHRISNRDAINGQSHVENAEDGDVSSDDSVMLDCWTKVHFERSLRCMASVLRKIKKLRFERFRENHSPIKVLRIADKLERLLINHRQDVQAIVDTVSRAIDDEAWKIQGQTATNSDSLPQATQSYSLGNSPEEQKPNVEKICQQVLGDLHQQKGNESSSNSSFVSASDNNAIGSNGVTESGQRDPGQIVADGVEMDSDPEPDLRNLHGNISNIEFEDGPSLLQSKDNATFFDTALSELSAIPGLSNSDGSSLSSLNPPVLTSDTSDNSQNAQKSVGKSSGATKTKEKTVKFNSKKLNSKSKKDVDISSGGQSSLADIEEPSVAVGRQLALPSKTEESKERSLACGDKEILDETNSLEDQQKLKSCVEPDEQNQLAKQLLLAECTNTSDSEKDKTSTKKNSEGFSDSSLDDFDTSLEKRLCRKKIKEESKERDQYRLSQDTKIQGTISVVLEKLNDKDVEGYLSGSMSIPSEDKGGKKETTLEREIDNLAKLPLPGKKTAKKKTPMKKSPKRSRQARTALLRIISSSSSEDTSDSDKMSISRYKSTEQSKIGEESRNDAARNALLLNCDSSFSPSDSISSDEMAKEKKLKSKKRLFPKDSDESRSNDDVSTKKKKKVDKLLRVPIRGPEEEKQKRQKDESRAKKPRRRPAVEDSDQEVGDTKSAEESDDSVVSASSSQEFQPTKKRKRIKNMKDSSSDLEKEDTKKKKKKKGEDEVMDTPSGKGRKNIRKLLDKEDLAAETKKATMAEKERRRRVLERQKIYNQVTDFEEGMKESRTRKLVLDVDQNSKEELVEVSEDLIAKLKPHQVEGVKFMWECTVESVQQLKEKKAGSGCVLAHCMGLGKTLQVIAYVHTLLTSTSIKPYIKTCLVVCPYNTVLNWASEFEHWLEDVEGSIEVFELANIKSNLGRADVLKNWQEFGGVLIVGYDMFRLLVSEKSKKIPRRLRDIFASTLLEPGPDVVVCDEGHILKNERTAISKAMSQIHCMRRIVLTGTPLQNNLQEYHCMVQFVKPHLLGQRKEFLNRFLNPITNGQCADSTPSDVKLMKKRVHILHKLLEGCVQRCDYSAVAAFLPPKHEYVVSVRLTEAQVKMYRHYLQTMTKGGNTDYGNRGTSLFKDFNKLRLIWTHPYMLQLDKIRFDRKNEFRDTEEEDEGDANSMASFIDDRSSPSASPSDSDSDVKALTDSEPKASTSTGKSENNQDEVINKWTTKSRGGKTTESESGETEKEAEKQWWNEYVVEEELMRIELSNKIVLLMDILRQCEAVGDKILIFTQSLLTLDMIEEFLKMEDYKTEADPESLGQDSIGTWTHGLDYFRMDGSTSVDLRKRWIQIFNDPDNDRARLFLISTKAGSLGTNLVGANRVVVMDASWNPTHDVQAIFRVYRFGQKKPVYIYRFLAQGTMEEKIYDRQVAKQSLACRVVDEQQMERHFTMADLMELYSFEPDSRSKRPTPLVPKDLLLADLISRHKDLIVSYHEHDSLLRKDAEEEDLNEEERKEAWAEYEAEKEGRIQRTNYVQGTNSTFLQGIDIQKMAEELRKKNPGASPRQIQEQLLTVIAALQRKKQDDYQKIYQAIQALSSQKQLIPPELKNQLGQAYQQMQQLMQLQNILKLQQQPPNQQQSQNPQQQSQNPQLPRFIFKQGPTFQTAPQNGPRFLPRQVPPQQYQYRFGRAPNSQSSFLYRRLTSPVVTFAESPDKVPSGPRYPTAGPIITEVDANTPSVASNASNIVITEVD